MQISITVESQEGLTWKHWKRFVSETEKLGYAGLFRSDHFPHTQPALELITSLAYVADRTQRIHFGSLVAPFSFRDPVMLARQAAALDDLSDGRLVLGLGAGWAVDEHRIWGYPLGDIITRSTRFQEGLEVITRLLGSDTPVTYKGQFYQLQEATLLPRPQRPGGPDILIGGNGVKRTLPLVARYADVWNVFHQTPENFRERAAILDDLLLEERRDSADVKRTMMGIVFCGRNEVELRRRADYFYRTWFPHLSGQSFSTLLSALEEAISPLLLSIGASFCPIVGTPEAVVDQIHAYAGVGLEELIIQWWDVEDIAGLRLYAETILPHFGK